MTVTSHDESTKILGGHFTSNNLQAISQQDKHFHTKTSKVTDIEQLNKVAAEHIKVVRLIQ